MKSKSALIIGTGSVAKKYASIFNSLQIDCYFVSHSGRKMDNCLQFSDRLPRWKKKFDLMVVASRTSRHIEHTIEYEHLAELILIEKPLADRLPSEEEFSSLMKCKDRIFVSYPIRFAPSFTSVIRVIESLDLLKTVTLNAKSDFLKWRVLDVNPDGYWLKGEEGGVLREYSHELDYAVYLFGFPLKYKTSILKNSMVDHSSLSTQAFVEYQTRSCESVNFDLSIDSKNESRLLQVDGDGEGLVWNLLTGHVKFWRYGAHENFNYGAFNQSHCLKLQVLSILSGKNKNLTCDYSQGLEVLRLIESLDRRHLIDMEP